MFDGVDLRIMISEDMFGYMIPLSALQRNYFQTDLSSGLPRVSLYDLRYSLETEGQARLISDESSPTEHDNING